MSTPQHCPGYENFKNLKSFICKCPDCGESKEIFSDEFDKTHPLCEMWQGDRFQHLHLRGWCLNRQRIRSAGKNENPWPSIAIARTGNEKGP